MATGFRHHDRSAASASMEAMAAALFTAEDSGIRIGTALAKDVNQSQFYRSFCTC